MRFAAKFLQSQSNANPSHRSGESPAGGTNLSLRRIYDVTRTPDGRLEGEDEDLARALKRSNALAGRTPVDAYEPEG